MHFYYQCLSYATSTRNLFFNVWDKMLCTLIIFLNRDFVGSTEIVVTMQREKFDWTPIESENVLHRYMESQSLSEYTHALLLINVSILSLCEHLHLHWQHLRARLCWMPYLDTCNFSLNDSRTYWYRYSIFANLNYMYNVALEQCLK